MSNVFEQTQQLFADEFNYWIEQTRTYTEMMAKEMEANVQLVREMAEKNQAAVERMVKKGEAVRKDFDGRATAFFSKLTEMKAA